MEIILLYSFLLVANLICAFYGLKYKNYKMACLNSFVVGGLLVRLLHLIKNY
jgi:hypothetical protein